MNTEKAHTCAAFQEQAGKTPRKAALVYLGTPYSYDWVLHQVQSLAVSLHQLGLREGDRVVLYLPNSAQWVLAWLAVQWIGAVPVPITPIYTARDLAYIANDTGAVAVFCADRNFGYVQQVLDSTPLKTIIVTNLADLLPVWKRLLGWAFDVVPRGAVERRPGVHSLRRLLSAPQHTVPPLRGGGDGMAEILYTGGTTKHPKGVPIGHRLYLGSTEEQLATSAPLFPMDQNVIAGGAPLFHILGQTCSLGTIFFGGTLLIFPKVKLDALMHAVQRFRAKTMIGVPALYRMILEHDRVEQYDLSSLQFCFCGGDVLPLEIEKRWNQRFRQPIFQGYGATETCGGIAMAPTDQPAPSRSMGRVLPGKEVRVTDPQTLTVLPRGESGELLVHSDPMVGAYWNKPEETAEAFVTLEGKLFYRTSDMVVLDEQDFLFFVDRTVDTIKHKGYRVSASEIEAVLQEHPAVIESCVVGIPDPKVGQRIKAIVVLKKDIKGITGYDLIKWARERLVSYKIPQYVEFRDMLPKSKVGKLLRREVRTGEHKRQEKDEKSDAVMKDSGLDSG
ncbi:MAG: AMP-binding protein [Desulfobacterota bacterium]|jgi:long-chain acyl-CoA synthetase|nr:AMP-binding protein [Thermodesulfobacteriota bacterium]